MRVRSASILPAMVTAALFLIVAAWTTPALAYKQATRCLGPIDESIVERADSIVFKMNPKGEVTFFNDFAQKYFGYQEKEILGKNALGYVYPQDRFLWKGPSPDARRFVSQSWQPRNKPK